MYVLSLPTAGPVVLSVGLLITFLQVAGFWMVFAKAGEPGWAAIVPIYNIYVLVKISNNEWWWLLVFLIPLIQIVAIVKIQLNVASEFDQGTGFAVGLILLPIVFYPLLGVGDYQYDAGPPSIRG